MKDSEMRKDINQDIEIEITNIAKLPCAGIDDKDKVKNKEKEEPKYIAPKPYIPPIPFPHRLAKANLDRRCRKFKNF